MRAFTRVVMNLLLLIGLFCVNTLVAHTRHHETPEVSWNDMAQKSLQESLTMVQNRGVAKNVILFLGDGMGISTVTAARIYNGQLQNKSGEEGSLAFDDFPHVALSKTYSVDKQVSDSACTATAYLCGVKTNDGLIGLNERTKRGQCETQSRNEARSILRWSRDVGKSVGFATTARITHATPAASYAHAADRNWECDADLPADARGRCDDIALQLVRNNKDIQVMLGGGRGYFLPNESFDTEYTDKRGFRTDGLNLVEEWRHGKQESGHVHQYAWNQTAFTQVDPEKTDYLLGLFELSHMKYELERHTDKSGEPSLTEMTEMAIKILRKNSKGFFLLVEGGRIDHGHHRGIAKKAVSETVAFSSAVQKATEMTSDEDTLIVVTADHSHTMTINGYPSRGNPIFGLNDGGDKLAADLLPYTTLSYANGPGYSIDNATGQRTNLTLVNTDDLHFKQQSAVPRQSETHAGEDVSIYARGPMAHLFHGVKEQNYIAHALAYASCVGLNKDHCKYEAKQPRSELEKDFKRNSANLNVVFIMDTLAMLALIIIIG